MEPKKVEPIVLETLPHVHRFSIFVIGNFAAYGAMILVEKGYIRGLTAIRARQNLTK